MHVIINFFILNRLLMQKVVDSTYQKNRRMLQYVSASGVVVTVMTRTSGDEVRVTVARVETGPSQPGTRELGGALAFPDPCLLPLAAGGCGRGTWGRGSSWSSSPG